MAPSSQTPLGIVAIEGPNAAGKSSVARHLADEFDGRVLRYSEAFHRLRVERDLDRAASPLERLTRYLDAIEELSERCLSSDGLTIIDRYFASPLSMLEAAGSLDGGVIREVAGPALNRIAMPDLTLLLTADPAVLAHRESHRSETRNSLSLEMTIGSRAFALAWMDAFRRWACSHGFVEEIDTTDISLQDVCSEAVHLVRTGRP